MESYKGVDMRISVNEYYEDDGLFEIEIVTMGGYRFRCTDLLRKNQSEEAIASLFKTLDRLSNVNTTRMIEYERTFNSGDGDRGAALV